MLQKISIATPKYDWILKEVEDKLAQFTVCFVKKLSNSSDTEDIILSGSGTLVKTEKYYGILTADHVLQNQDPNQIGLIFPNRCDNNPQRRFYPTERTRKLRIAPASYTEEGPDLGFLILNSIDARDIETKMSFYDLPKRREKMQFPRSVDKGGWFLSGGIAEGTTEGPPERKFTKVKIFRGICALGAVQRERIFSQFDYLDFELDPPPNEKEAPKNFEGMSGGGLWQIVIENLNGELKIVEYLLSGIAYYQIIRTSDKKPEKIICHGRRSIYDKVINELDMLQKL